MESSTFLGGAASTNCGNTKQKGESSVDPPKQDDTSRTKPNDDSSK